MITLDAIADYKASSSVKVHGLTGSSKKARRMNADSRVSGENRDWSDHVRRIHENADEAAFAELFEHFAPRVKAFLIRSGASNSMAEECAQDVMATLWHKSHMFDPSRASVSTWIFTIARNRKVDLLRKQRRPEPEQVIWGPEEEPSQEEIVSKKQDSARLSQALKRLPQKQRELIEKAYYGDLSHSEIAKQTGLPLGTIKSRIRLALERMRHELKTESGSK